MLILLIIFLCCPPPRAGAGGVGNERIIAGFDFPGGLLENGFDGWRYAGPGTNPCGVRDGIYQGYFCKGAGLGRQTLSLYYNTYNNDHMGWLRWGYLDAESRFKVRGSSLKVVLTGGAYSHGGKVRTSGQPVKSKAQFEELVSRGVDPFADRILPGDASLYVKTGSSVTPFESLRGMDRIGLWLLFPKPEKGRFESQRTSPTYRRPGFTFSLYPFIDDSRGGHYYHGITNIPMGGWIRVEFDAHPYHYNGGDKNPYAFYRAGGYEAPGDPEAYFRRMVTFAFVASEMRDHPSPAAFYLDEVTAFSRSKENQETISSLAVGYDPERRRFDISLTDKYRCRDCNGQYEVRYAFSPISQASFDRATPCRVINFNRSLNNDEGRIDKPNNGYNQIWAGLELAEKDRGRLGEGATVHFAVKDVSDRSHLPDRDPYDEEPVEVGEKDRVRRRDLIRTLAYTIHEVPWPLVFEEVQDRYDLKQDRPADIRFSASGGSRPYFFYAMDLPEGLFLDAKGGLSGKPSGTGHFSSSVSVVDKTNRRMTKTVGFEVQPVEDCTDGLDNDSDGDADCRDTECHDQDRCGRLLVDFGDGPWTNRFGIPGWDRVKTDRYTGYAETGTTSTVKGSPEYDYQQVSGPAMTLAQGSLVLVSWINAGAQPLKFTPRISFTAPGRYGDSPGLWRSMSSLELAPGETGVTRYEVGTSEGKGGATGVSLISINANYSNSRSLVCDKIRLIP